MKESDKILLEDIRQFILRYSNGVTLMEGDADQVAILRDMLEFNDDEWYQKLTRRLIDLDSASSFRPMNDEEKKILQSTIMQVQKEILTLIERKLNGSE